MKNLFISLKHRIGFLYYFRLSWILSDYQMDFNRQTSREMSFVLAPTV